MQLKHPMTLRHPVRVECLVPLQSLFVCHGNPHSHFFAGTGIFLPGSLSSYSPEVEVCICLREGFPSPFFFLPIHFYG